MTEKNNIIKAINKNVRSGARKANLILKFIKGKKADIAIRDLEFTRKGVAHDIKKTVKSAIANAENNYQYDIDNLYVKEAYVGKSIVMKRFRPAPFDLDVILPKLFLPPVDNFPFVKDLTGEPFQIFFLSMRTVDLVDFVYGLYVFKLIF